VLLWQRCLLAFLRLLLVSRQLILAQPFWIEQLFFNRSAVGLVFVHVSLEIKYNCQPVHALYVRNFMAPIADPDIGCNH